MFVVLNTSDFPLGFYMPALDWKYCTSKMVCLHEDAHQYDWTHGHPSQDPEFRKEMDKIPAIFLIQTEGDKYAEAYAWFWAIENGHVPYWFEQFYPKEM
jgi:hypothetical protein